MSVVDRLEQVCFLLKLDVGGADGAPPTVAAYDTFYNTHVVNFLNACKAIDDKDIKDTIAGQAEVTFQHQRTVLYGATSCAKPAAEALMAFLGPIAKAIGDAGNIPRRTKWVDHFKAWSEAIQAVQWLCMDGGGAYILSQRDAVTFNTNRILKAARDMPDQKVGAAHKAFVTTLVALLNELVEYVNGFHKQGIIWKHGGGSVAEYKAPGAGAATTKTDEQRLVDAVAALEAYAAKQGGGSGDGPPPAVAAWQEVVTGPLAAFVSAATSAELKLDAKLVPAMATAAWTHVGRVVEASFASKKQSDEKFMEFLGPIVGAMNGTAEPNRRDAAFDTIKGFNEVVTALAWVTMPGGVDYIQTQIDASKMYTNRLLKAAREEKNEAKANALKAYVNTLTALGTATKEYVNEWFKQGIIWKGSADALPATFTHFPL